MSELVEFLKNVHIFSQLSDLERDAVSAFLENRQVPAEGYVCRQGDKGAEIFIIKSGSVSTFITTSSEGEREISAKWRSSTGFRARPAARRARIPNSW
jgi:CRP-like cAMP-binding protein